MDDNGIGLTELAMEIVASYVGNHNIRPEDVPAFIASTHAAVAGLAGGEATPEPAVLEHVPAVTARKSLSSKDHIISMIDGKPYKTLRRHLATNGLTPAEYRERYGLKPDYPMVAESYSATRRELAQKIGLGRKVKSVAANVIDAASGAISELIEGDAPRRRGRKPKAEAAPAAETDTGATD